MGQAEHRRVSPLWIMYLWSRGFLKGRGRNYPKQGGSEHELAHSYMLSVLSGGRIASKATALESDVVVAARLCDLRCSTGLMSFSRLLETFTVGAA